MIYKIKPKGYPEKSYDVAYRSYDPESIFFSMANYQFVLSGRFEKGNSTPISCNSSFTNFGENAAYISPLYEQIKKHCETWLANPVEPFPWESEEEFERNK